MTARLPEEPVRVTNWLAGWLDYVCATVMTAGRWFRLPAIRGGKEPVMMAAFAPAALRDSYSHSWQDTDDSEGSGRIIRLLEIGMLSVSFFLAAHLLSGGTPTVSAPNLNAFQLGQHRAQAAALPVPGTPGREVKVDAASFATNAAPASAEAAVASVESQAADTAAQTTEEIAVLPPAAGPETHAAGATAPAPEPETAPPPAQAVPDPAPAAIVPPASPPAVTTGTTADPSPDDRYLTSEELRAAAIAAGWPVELLPEVEAVAWCESRNHTHAQNFGALGIMQMVGLWFGAAGLNPDHWWDPVVNLRAAKHAYDEQIRLGVDGWAPWACKPW